ncbi:IS5 family transposase [Gemmata sp. SH-PL17]|uniref:IS5 family transposase n=1 Tax=Gemmata sp. SH-PL17 TaxID=1630693 RepID=UPI00139049E7|nr:IS5 family transposase [Gemmata sp. SH-PL17]
MSRKPYPTDLTDEQWERLAPLLPQPKSGTPGGGRPATVDRREIVNAIFYHLRAGGAWRMIPHDFPAWQTVYGLFRDWRRAGVWEKVHSTLREEVRIEAGAPPTPETLRVDSQTVKTTHRRPFGVRRGKKVNGRKRFIGSIRSGWSGPRRYSRPTSRIGTAGGGCWARCVACYHGCVRSSPTVDSPRGSGKWSGTCAARERASRGERTPNSDHLTQTGTRGTRTGTSWGWSGSRSM